MSGLITPAAFHVTYQCASCKTYYAVPISALEAGNIDGYSTAYWRLAHGIPTRCLSCIIVLGAIEKLHNLCVTDPYLLTEGMAGAPRKEAWELEEKVDSGRASVDSLGDGRSAEESERFCLDMAKSFVETAGKAVCEEEVYEKKETEAENK